MPVAGGLGLQIRLLFHNHAPQQVARGFALYQEPADQLGRHIFCGAVEEALGDGWEGSCGYWRGCVKKY
jgi:hypothetical protein